MPLHPGTRIGGYEILALLGAGGMGEVYRARDLRLAREVAIKVLSSQIAADANALMRFEREARALASLNHPNIGSIYGVEDNGSDPALILELVGGDVLADRLAARGAIPLSEALDYAKQIADALDVAHEAGIVHRDLKPGNIKITEEGRLKVLDFGLAKAIAAAAGEPVDFDPQHSPTITVHGTKHGVIVGTAAYMSPEQARGKRIDRRTDIWAFGCVLFEMLTGKRAFTGETTSDVIAAIIERAPDLQALPTATPMHVRRVIERCLEKDPKRRARDIADVRHALEGHDASPVPTRRSWLPLAAAIAVALVSIGVAGWSWRSAPVAAPEPVEFVFGAPAGYRLATMRPMVSPDDRHIAFIARNDQASAVFVRSLDATSSRRIAGTEGAINNVHWSPDSRSFAFLANSTWKRVSIDGGPAVTIVGNVVANIGGSWSRDDIFLAALANRTSLVRVPISGGQPEQVTTLDPEKENSHRWPLWLPDGRHFLFTARSDRPENLGIRVGTIGTNEVRALVNVASPGVYANPGWLLFITPDQALMAQRIDPASWTLQGTAQPVAGGVFYNGPSFNGSFDASLGGRVLTYLPASDEGSALEWFDRTGKHLGRLGPERRYRAARLSPDNRQVVVEIADEQIGTRDLWLIDTATGGIQRLTANPATDWRAVFSRDGGSLAFASDRAGVSAVFRTSTSVGGDETPLFRSPEGGVFAADWSPDGTRLLVNIDRFKGLGQRLAEVSLNGGEPTFFESANADDFSQSRYSPSGDRVAFVSRNAGVPDVYVLSLRDQQRVRVSTDGGWHPKWGADGRELFFLSTRNEIKRVVLDGLTIASRPQVVFQPCAGINRTLSAVEADVPFDVARDGRFLVNCFPPSAVPPAIHVVVNWQSRLK